MQLSRQGITPPGISTLSISSETNLMPSTFLTGCHNYHLSVDQWSLIVMMSSWQIPLCCNLSLRISGCPSMNFPIWALCFCIVSERLFACLTSPALWGKARADFITNASRKATSTEITPLAILIMQGVGEGRLAIIPTFCQSDQAKVEPSDVLSTLVQQDSPEPSVVVVKIFTNSTYLP